MYSRSQGVHADICRACAFLPRHFVPVPQDLPELSSSGNKNNSLSSSPTPQASHRPPPLPGATQTPGTYTYTPVINSSSFVVHPPPSQRLHPSFSLLECIIYFSALPRLLTLPLGSLELRCLRVGSPSSAPPWRMLSPAPRVRGNINSCKRLRNH